MSFKKSSPRLCLNTLVCWLSSHFLTCHCHLFATVVLCDPRIFLLKSQSLFAETSAWAEQPQATFNILFTSIFSKVMKENIMLLKGNKLLLFASKEKAQPACISTREIPGKWLLILDNGMPWTCCSV